MSGACTGVQRDTPFKLVVPGKPALVVHFTSASVRDPGERKLMAEVFKTRVRIGACECYGLRIELRDHWNDEVSWVHAERALSEDGVLCSALTASALPLLRKAVAEQLRQYGGFNRAWLAVFGSSRYHDSTDADDNATALRRVAVWWDRCADLRRLIEEGAPVEYRNDPLPHSRHQRQIGVPNTSSSRHGDWQWATVNVRIMLAGEQIGWVTSDNELVPMDDLARRPQ